MSTAGWIAFTVFAGFAAMLLAVGVREWRLQRRLLAHARPVEGLVLSVTIRHSASRDTDPSPGRNTSTSSYTPDVRFRYRVGGRSYESDRLGASDIRQGHASHDAAAREVAAFVLGRPVTVLVDPAHPELGFLRAGHSAGPAVFMTLGLAIPPLVWWVGHHI